MRKSIWFINKYSRVETEDEVGTRDFMILKEMVKLGNDCLLIRADDNHLDHSSSLNSRASISTAHGVSVCELRTIKYSRAKSLKRIFSWLDFEWNLFTLPKKQFVKPDVVIASSLSLLSILNGIKLKKKFSCKLVFEVRDIWPLTLTEEGGFSERNFFIKVLSWVEKYGYQKADIIVGTMPNLKEHVAQILGYEKDTYCIPMGINEAQINYDGTLVPSYKNAYFSDDKIIVGYAGTIGITNALDVFFNCARLLKDEKRISFLVVGSGGLKDHYIEKVKDLENVVFSPKVPKNMVPLVLSQCSLVYFSVFKSKVWDYGQSLNKVIDYMLSGRPIIGSYSGFPSMVNEAECGVFVPAEDAQALKDAILRFADMPSEERDAIGARGREWIIANRRFTKLAQNYLDIMFPQI